MFTSTACKLVSTNNDSSVVELGSNITLSVELAGCTNPQITWKDVHGRVIGTGERQTLTNVKLADAGVYRWAERLSSYCQIHYVTFCLATGSDKLPNMATKIVWDRTPTKNTLLATCPKQVYLSFLDNLHHRNMPIASSYPLHPAYSFHTPRINMSMLSAQLLSLLFNVQLSSV